MLNKSYNKSRADQEVVDAEDAINMILLLRVCLFSYVLKTKSGPLNYFPLNHLCSVHMQYMLYEQCINFSCIKCKNKNALQGFFSLNFFLVCII